MKNGRSETNAGEARHNIAAVATAEKKHCADHASSRINSISLGDAYAPSLPLSLHLSLSLSLSRSDEKYL